MGIEDIQISEELETNAPSIRYRGNEGPKSPQEEQEMAMKMAMEAEKAQAAEMAMAMEAEEAMMAVEDYSSRAYRDKLIGQLMDTGGLDYGSASVEADRIIEIKLRPRTKAAFGGIMGLDGRRQYGFGSSLKKRLRKLIPNEIAKVAEIAAPFVAPFNPLAAGLMSGIGGFDRTGRIGSSIKSGLKNYAMGQAGRYLGGADFQKGFDPRGGMDAMKYGFSKPTGSGGIKNLFNKSTPVTNTNITTNNLTGNLAEGQAGSNLTGNINDEFVNEVRKQGYQTGEKGFLGKTIDKIKEYVPTSFTDLKDPNKVMGGIGLLSAAGGLYTAFTQDEAVDEIMDRGEGLDIIGIRTEVQEAFKDPSGKKLAALRSKYPYLGTQRSKNQAAMAMGGRIRRAEGGLMDLGGMEKDYRAEGGFVPIGKAEKADDVPARLSVNEFVFTADAVRNAGGGDIDKGAEVMENLMKNLEQGGQVSKESQGMQGAREMFQTSQRLGDIL